MEDSLKRFFPSTIEVVMRSEIHPAAYNPRRIAGENRRCLKNSLKDFGVLGGIIVNRRTGMTIVGGHQKVDILDQINGYPEKDYRLRVELIDVDERTEKTINVALNNPNNQGTWDLDAMARLVPDIDYKSAGLGDADLSLFGLDYLMQTAGENEIGSAIDGMMAPVDAAKAAEREMTDEEKAAHMKEVKAEVREKAVRDAQDMDAYVMLSFSSWAAKAAFLARFGYPEDVRFVKGEEFDGKVEAVS